MKTLAIIWAAVVVTALATGFYINSQINALSVGETVTIKEVKTPYNPQRTINGELLQPAAKVQPNFTSTYNPQQTAPASTLNTAKEIN